MASTSTGRSTPHGHAAKRQGPSTQKAVPAKKTKTSKTPKIRDWRDVDLNQRQKDRFKWDVPARDVSRLPTTPVELFEVFFDDEVIQMMVDNSERYARSKGNEAFKTSQDEMRAFLGILLVSGYSPMARRRMYLSHDDDVTNKAISSAMTRDRFDEMMRFLHVSDNTNLDAQDKMAKVRPLVSMLNERFLHHFIPCQNLSIDESMIPYYGRHSSKQFIRCKPIRFGYKMWVLTTPLGYVIQFEPYQGARGGQQQYPGLGMGGSVVIDLVSELQENCSFHLTFDNLFTSLPLVDCLTEKGIACTGTIRANRLENCPVKSVAEMQKMKRGSFDLATDVRNGLTVVRWNDNNVVNLVSNKVGVNPLQVAKRWSRAESRRIEIPQPFIIKHYNETMGGVDRMDQNVNQYRTSIRSKKWYWPIIAYCLDVSVQQTWHLYRATPASQDKPLDLLAVRRSIARTYLTHAPKAKGAGRPSHKGRTAALDKRVPTAVRLDGKHHLVEPWPTQLRCAACGMKTKRRCQKCEVGLHDKCFAAFHTP